MQRREARELLLSALYRCEFIPAALDEVFEDTDPADQREYIETVFNGIRDRQPEIDHMLGEKTVGWKFERLALLDRNILRIGVYELLYFDDVPPEVALDQAVELAKKFGTEQARKFINGILDRIWKEHREPASS
ncbi:transcription antitermination factor NusB [Candidatus Bipolaricaulota bacterium]|nr:transcription antitermination factor NusB [Candidatus Bipolaricaulota bacterium]